MSAYLFIHFTMDGERDEETIWFSVSRDGLHWNDIGTDTPILKSEIGRNGIRDPFIVYDEKLNKYFIIATDMNTSGNFDWDTAHLTGSRSIIVWESDNLIDFSEPWLAEVGVDNAGCAWAPEAIYCKEKNAWFVFWASCVKEPEDETPKQRIYGAFTSDFKSFSETFKYIEADKDIIDTDIIFADGYYYRFSKDDTNKCVTIERSQDLLGDFERVRSGQIDALEGVEGPLAYYLEEEKKWCLLLDFYRDKGGYIPYLATDISKGNFERLSITDYDMGTRKKRHGGIISISDAQYNAFITENGGNTMNYLTSPNGKIKINIFAENSIPLYSVYADDEEIIKPSMLGLVTSIADFSQGVEFSNMSDIEYHNEKYSLLSAKKRVCENIFNEMTVAFSKSDKKMLVTLRAYDNGIAFCYLIENDADFEIVNENTAYMLSGKATVWHNDCYKENYEFQYVEDKITELSSNEKYKNILMPLLVRLENGTYLQICETNLNSGYSGTMLIPTDFKDCVKLKTHFVMLQNGNVKTNRNFKSPWRYIVIGDEATIVENTMSTDLADAPDENIDYSFVKPGSTSWTWLDNERDTTQWCGHHQHNTVAIKNHLDLANEMGWHYYIMDEGWQPPCDIEGEQYSGYYDDFAEWKAYADEKGVSLIAWCPSKDLNTEKKRERLADWKEHGIVGIKVDFFDCENQQTLRLYEDIYKACAKLGMLVIAHGANKSVGEERTYPNVLTKEGIYGQEQGNIPAKNSIACVFTRYATGNTDYTEYLVPRDTNTKIGFHLAMSIIYTSGMHCFADGVTSYRTNESAQIMLRDFPSYFDETKYIAGNPSDYISLARRCGDTWYVAGISDIDIEQEISFDFLESNKKYNAVIFTDSDDYLKPNKSERIMESDDKLVIPLTKNGGYAIKITVR